ncbi:MAG: hypothetical protein D4R64_12410 [Porphyromonadaceae bacterium]|nr:MAG: hypothetical protein D4R64_12410 [Porphyromonadaceae bacterium]
MRLPPDAGGIVQNSAGISLNYFRSVSLIRLLFLSARRSICYPGFSRAASVAFAVAVSSRSKNLTLIAVFIAHLVSPKVNAKNDLSRVFNLFVFTSYQLQL